jgi:hypothetical protein
MIHARSHSSFQILIEALICKVILLNMAYSTRLQTDVTLYLSPFFDSLRSLLHYILLFHPVAFIDIVAEHYICYALLYTVLWLHLLGSIMQIKLYFLFVPELPQVEMVALTGKAIEGDVLTAVEVIPKSETQRNVWSKYKKEVKYQW